MSECRQSLMRCAHSPVHFPLAITRANIRNQILFHSRLFGLVIGILVSFVHLMKCIFRIPVQLSPKREIPLGESGQKESDALQANVAFWVSVCYSFFVENSA